MYPMSLDYFDEKSIVKKLSYPKLMQKLAMSDDEERVMTSIFVTELEQIFKAIMTKVEDRQQTEILTELKRCLPDHFMTYMYIFNMETMESVKESQEIS